MFIFSQFKLNDDNSIYITGPRGIGKTTTALLYFYSNELPFFYINLKYFIKSKDELEKEQILDYEKNNLFKAGYLKFIDSFSLQLINYENEIFELLEKLNHLTYNENNNIIKIEFISLIIEILTLIYKKLNEKIVLGDNESIKMTGDLNKIIGKIKLFSIPLTLIAEESYNSNHLINSENLYNFIKNLLYYKTYLSYLTYIEDMKKYTPDNIWEFIELLLKECEILKIQFFLILDQYKNNLGESSELDKIIKDGKKQKILILSSIDDVNIRNAIIYNNPKYIILQDELFNIEDIKIKYNDIFEQISDSKKKAIILFKNNVREIFECLNTKDENINKIIVEKKEKIKQYFQDFCKLNLARISYIIFIFKNINLYWEEGDYNEIRKYIPFKYFTFEKIQRPPSIFIGNLGTVNNKNNNMENVNEKEKHQIEKIENIHCYKINFSMPIVANSLFEFIKDENNISIYEQLIQMNSKGCEKGTMFEEYIKCKISNGLITPIENLKIDKTLEIWSVFSKSSSDNLGLFEGKLNEKKIYFIDIRNQSEPLFDCCIIDLINNKIYFCQITISKEVTHDVFSKYKIEKKGKNAFEFLKKNFIKDDIKFDICFFFIFLKFNVKKEPDFLDDTSKKIFNDMNKVNEQLKKMINKCKEQNLKYCIYNLDSILSENRNVSHFSYNKIDKNDPDLYIIKKDDYDNELSNDIYEDLKANDDSIFLKRKRNSDFLLQFQKIDLLKKPYIKKFYDYFCKKFNIRNFDIYEDNQLHTFNELEGLSKSYHFFAIINQDEDDDDIYNDNYIIIYIDSNLSIYDIQTNTKSKLNNNYKKLLYQIYYLEDIINLEPQKSLVQSDIK